MKRITSAVLSLLLLAATTFSSCDKVKDLAKVSFTLDNADGELVIPQIITVGSAQLTTENVYMNLDSMIKAQNGQVGAKNIREVHVKSCELVLLDGDKDNNFSALQSYKMTMSSNTNPAPVSFGEVTDNPDTESYSLALPTGNIPELKDYFLNATTFNYTLSATARKTTSKALHCQVKVTYTIVAGL